MRSSPKQAAFALTLVLSFVITVVLLRKCDPSYVDQIANGMSLQDVQSVFGEIPGHDLHYNGHVMWQADERLFFVYFDESGKVYDKAWWDLANSRQPLWKKVLNYYWERQVVGSSVRTEWHFVSP